MDKSTYNPVYNLHAVKNRLHLNVLKALVASSRFNPDSRGSDDLFMNTTSSSLGSYNDHFRICPVMIPKLTTTHGKLNVNSESREGIKAHSHGAITAVTAIESSNRSHYLYECVHMVQQ